MKQYLGIFFTITVIAGCGGGITGERIADYDKLVQKGWEEYNQGRYDDAYQLFLSARSEDGNRPEAFIGCGWSLLRRQHPDSASVVFRTGIEHISTLADSVDLICGLAGSYLARGDDTKVIDLFKKYTVSSYEAGFPLKKHDFLIDETDLEIVQAMACYRLGLYSPEQRADPDNAVYHMNLILLDPIEFTDEKTLLDAIVDFLEQSKGEYYL